MAEEAVRLFLPSITAGLTQYAALHAVLLQATLDELTIADRTVISDLTRRESFFHGRKCSVLESGNDRHRVRSGGAIHIES